MLLPKDALAWAQKRYAAQHKQWLAGEGVWPVSINLGALTEKQFMADVPRARAWAQAWQHWSGAGAVAWDTRTWPAMGAQTLPRALVFQSPEELAQFVGAGEAVRWRRATARFAELMALAVGVVPKDRLARHFEVLADYPAPDWERLCAALRFFATTPASGLYVRQLPIAGMDTKWIEKRTAVLTSLTQLLRGEHDTNPDFYAVCGLRRTPYRIRMKVLCPTLRKQVGGLRDIEGPIEELATLAWSPAAVLIVENQETGIALPDMPGVVAFMRMGNAVTNLTALPWLHAVPGVYWGDLDTYGLVIYSRAKAAFPLLQPALMDEGTLLAHQLLWAVEDKQHPACDQLPAEVEAVFAGLKQNRWGDRVRLEQERLPWAWAIVQLQKALAELVAADGAGRVKSGGAQPVS